MGGGGKNTSTSTSDPFANMPDWQKEAIQGDVEFRQKFLEQGGDLADWLAENPREILGLSPDELAGRDILYGGGEQADWLSDIAAGRLGKDYESEYTDDVVDTTLAGMERQRQRDRLREDAAAAATGGTSNTRAAVAQAVGDNLSGMNMAEMEAKIRDDAFRFGSEMGLAEGQFANQMANDSITRALGLGGSIGAIGEAGRSLAQAQLDANRGSGQEALSWLGNLYAGTNTGHGPTGGTQTQTTPGPSTFSQILGVGTTLLGGFLSDETTKEDIVPMEVGLDALKDVTPATYEYKEGMPTDKRGRTAGLMAQDLEHIPGAVETGADGYKRVDAYPVLATVVQAVKELDKRTS